MEDKGYCEHKLESVAICDLRLQALYTKKSDFSVQNIMNLPIFISAYSPFQLINASIANKQ